MKKLFTILCTILLLAVPACQHEEIWEELRDHGERIEQLEEQCRKLNSNIEALQKIIDALQENDYVTKVTVIEENGVEVGYRLSFAKSGDVTVYNNITDGAVPQFRVSEGYWYASFDDGVTWHKLGKVGEEGSQKPLFSDVSYDEEYVYLTLADGSIITIPLVSTSRSFAGKVVSIMGDSISTFEGWIPIEDGHNLNHRKRYPQANLFEDVRLTWWHKLITNLGAKLGVNDSWAGSMVINTDTVNSGDKGPDACMASITRITNLGSNGTPDLIFFYGGTNDAARNVPLGTFDPGTVQQVDLTSTTWSTFADAYAAAIMRMQHFYPEAKIIAMTPTWTTSYYTAQRLDAVVKVIKEVCDYFGVAVVDLRKCGINQNNLDKTLGDGIHPSALGMEMIEKYLRKQLLSFYEGDYTENIVYKVTDNLTSAINLDRYITGVSSGRPYTAQLSGDLSYVGVKMGGYDITSAAFNVSTGIIHIPEVTGDIHIDESVQHETVQTTWYIDHTKNKTKFTSSCNTGGRGWAIADTNPAYSQLIGKPINTAAFFTNKTSQTVTVMKIPSYKSTTGEVIATVTATIPYASKQLAVIHFPEVTLKDGEYLALFSQEDSNIQFYYTSAGVEDASGVLDNGFYTRLPILYGSGTNWSLAENSCLGWSFGYTENDDAGVEDSKKSIKILAIGNSFSVDAMQYLYGMLEDVGYEEIVLGNLYIGSCSLSLHANNFQANSASYTYYTNSTGKWNNVTSYAPIEALKDEDWDYITMQQNSGNSGLPSTYEPHLSNLVSVVRSYCPESELVWHMTWAYQGDSTHSGFANYGNDQLTMYNAIVDATQEVILTNGEFKKIIPNGTAVQNLRTSYIGDNLTRDGYHMSYDNGRYLAAMTFAKALTGCSLEDITYRPSSYSYSDKEIAAIIEAANSACSKPFEITASSYPPDPDAEERDYTTASLTDIISWEGYDPEKYVQLDIQFSEHAFYNSTDSKYVSTMITKENSDKSNLVQYIATPIYDRNDLPEGTLIVQRSGQQYRPEGWTALDEYNSESIRPGEVKDNLIIVGDTWWSNWNYRAFNISKANKPSLTSKYIEDLKEGFGIFIPKA